MSIIEEEKLKRYAVDEETGCWIWSGGKRGGYGRVKVEGRLMEAHRVSYEFHIGKIPEGLCIDHLCRNRACINPAHLEPVTLQENIRRGEVGKGPRTEKQKIAARIASIKRFSDPVNRAAQIIIMKEAFKSPKRAASMKVSHQTIEYRNAQSDRIKKSWIMRRSVQCQLS